MDAIDSWNSESPPPVGGRSKNKRCRALEKPEPSIWHGVVLTYAAGQVHITLPTMEANGKAASTLQKKGVWPE